MARRLVRLLAVAMVVVAPALSVPGGPAGAQLDRTSPPPDPGTTLIRLGPGSTHLVAADAASGTVLVGAPSGAGLLAFGAEGNLRARIMQPDVVSDLVFDRVAGRFWVALPSEKQLAAIDPVTLTVQRYDVPPAAGCPQQLAVAAGLVVFISPYAVGGCEEENAGYHALDPQSGQVSSGLAEVAHGLPYRLASAGDGILYAAETDWNSDALAAYTVSPSPAPGLSRTAWTQTHDSHGAYWVRDLTATPDTGRALVGGTAPGYQVITPSLAYDPVQPQGMYHLQWYVAAGAGVTAYSPGTYGSNPLDEDIAIYKNGQNQPFAMYDFGKWGNSSYGDEVDGLAIGRHLYAVTEHDQPPNAYLRIIDLPLPVTTATDPPDPAGAAGAAGGDPVWEPGPGSVRGHHSE
jgi:hypothetical protein